MKLKYCLLTVLLPLLIFSQKTIKDTVYGNVKSVREKMFFLDSVRQNYKLFQTENEYGHHGFTSREATLKRNTLFWYHLPFVHYVNYFREYNIKNQITKEIWYYKNGQFLTEYQFVYDKEDKLIETKEIESDGKLWSSERRNYNLQKQVSSTLDINYYDNGYFFTHYEYDKSGKLSKKENFSHEKGSAWHYEYDGDKLKKVFLSRPYAYECNEVLGHMNQIYKSKSELIYEYEYDEKGNKIKFTNYTGEVNGASLSTSIIRFTYAPNNLLTGVYTNDDNRSIQKFIYNSKNQLIQEDNFVKDNLQERCQYFYNKDNLIKMIYFEDGESSTSEFEYKFDIQNNWTEQLKIVDGKRLYIRKREIEYY